MGHRNELVQKYIDADRYDLLIYLSPDVKWVEDYFECIGYQHPSDAEEFRGIVGADIWRFGGDAEMTQVLQL